MCLRYDIIHIVLRSFVIQICYFFITLNALVNSGQCCVLNARKQIVSLICLEFSYLVLVCHILETFQNVLSHLFCKEHNIKQVSPLLASSHTKQNLGVLNVKSVYCI